ncbi:hypothetical protein LMH73_009155 [Vibrio splendidus]|nr:hypothetical protein [Vibrio splendidus]MCC4880308.1 hypothetical protein [Vibrio splendidus]
MSKKTQELKLVTGRFYDFEQELHCYLEAINDSVTTYFIVDPSRGMTYEISSSNEDFSSEAKAKSTIMKLFMADQYNGSPMYSGEKLNKFGWANCRERRD